MFLFKSKFFWFFAVSSLAVFLFWLLQIGSREMNIERVALNPNSPELMSVNKNFFSGESPQSDEIKIIAQNMPETFPNQNDFINATSSEKTISLQNNNPPAKRLTNPPKEIKAIYVTSWTAGNPDRIDELLGVIKKNNLNAVVIDVKDFSGSLAFKANLEQTVKIGAEQNRIPDFTGLINKLHGKGIYVIARIAVFQDSILAHKQSQCAIKSKKGGGIWLDRKGLSWIDPASKEAWQYNVLIAKKIAACGVDELNFDYIRFPSDGDLADLSYPEWDERTPKQEIIKNFFAFLANELSPLRQNNHNDKLKISADLFGLTAINYDDLGIGQVLENAAPYFDYISPMVYPSHYASGFLGYKNPANYPYEVVIYSLKTAKNRLAQLTQQCNGLTSTTTATEAIGENKISVAPEKCDKKIAGLRPWLQVFNLGADYTAEMINLEIKAVKDAGLSDGYYLWDPSNMYYNLKITNTE